MLKSLFLFLFDRNYKFKGTFFLSLFKLDKNNYVKIHRSRIMRSKIFVSGYENDIVFNGTSISKSQIIIEGQKNRLVIENGANINNLFLSINGNGNFVKIGRNSFIHKGFLYSGSLNNSVIIGDDCLFAHDVDIMGADSHQILQDGKEINHSKNIIIGNHVWVAAHSTILKGVTIGDDAIIGAGSIVTKDVQANTVNGGNPCRLIKENVTWSIQRENI